MSQLRDQLRTARTEYGALTYPGVLADEILPERRRLHIGRWLLLGTGFGAGSLAAAAAIALALVNFLPRQAERPIGGEMIARVTSSETFGVLSQLPDQLSHITVVPVEKIRSTLHYFGVQNEPNPSENAAPPPDRDHASA